MAQPIPESALKNFPYPQIIRSDSPYARFSIESVGKRLKLNYFVLTFIKKYVIIIKKDFLKCQYTPEKFFCPFEKISYSVSYN